MKYNLFDKATILSEAELNDAAGKYADILDLVKQGEDCYRDSLGWHDPLSWCDDTHLSEYCRIADEVKQNSDAFVVIGIGGSNQAARAVIDSIGTKSGVEIIWAGNTISAREAEKMLDSLEGKDFHIDVIAKNFETLEPGLGFRLLRKKLKEKYGEAYNKRVIATGTIGSHLNELCDTYGYTFLPFPTDIGGRFSALSPVGLLPMAVAGLDLSAMRDAAVSMRNMLLDTNGLENPAYKYALIRNLLYKKGFRIEMLSFFEPDLYRFSKWHFQLFGESEGKDNKGLFPIMGNFSEDLHSIGQFIQDGTNILFETFINVADPGANVSPSGDDLPDRFDYLGDKSLTDINNSAYKATISAHSSRFPCMEICIDKIDEAAFGELFYFFFFACYLSARILGVNPFDQPGVEAYKVNMFEILGKLTP